MSIFSILGRSFRRVQYHELKRMFGRLFLSSFSLQRFCNNNRYYNSDINRRIFRLQFIYNFVECFSRVKSIPWCGFWFLVRRFPHITNNVNLFCVSIQLFHFSGSKKKEHFLQTNFSASIFSDFQMTNGSVRVHFLHLNIFEFAPASTNSWVTTHESLTHCSRDTHSLLTSHSLPAHCSRVTHSLLTSNSCELLTSHSLHCSRVTHELLTSSRVTLEQLLTSHSRATAHESLTNCSRATTHELLTSPESLTRHSLTFTHEPFTHELLTSYSRTTHTHELLTHCSLLTAHVSLTSPHI